MWRTELYVSSDESASVKLLSILVYISVFIRHRIVQTRTSDGTTPSALSMLQKKY